MYTLQMCKYAKRFTVFSGKILHVAETLALGHDGVIFPHVHKYFTYIDKHSYFLLSLTHYLFDLCLSSVLERPTSQMSYLEHFLKETTSSTRHGSVDSVEGDIEDNRAPSITSSKSNLSELSIVSNFDTFILYIYKYIKPF